MAVKYQPRRIEVEGPFEPDYVFQPGERLRIVYSAPKPSRTPPPRRRPARHPRRFAWRPQSWLYAHLRPLVLALLITVLCVALSFLVSGLLLLLTSIWQVAL